MISPEQTSSSQVRTTATTTTLALFLLSMAWFRSNQRHRRIHDANNEQDTTNDSLDLGPRGKSAIMAPTSYWNAFLTCLRNPCDPETNPTGYIALCLAENKLVQEALALRLMQRDTSINGFSDSIVYCYNGFLGLPAVREAFAFFLERRFGKFSGDPNNKSVENGVNGNDDYVENAQQKQLQINPEHVALGSGCGSLLSHLFFLLAQKEDVVLIPAPYYSAYEYGMKVIAECVPFPVIMENPVLGPTKEDLESAAQLAEKEGKRVKFLLLTNPNDPLGVVYGPEIIRGAVQWARTRQGVHTIVNEIHALSVRQGNSSKFQSVIQVLNNQLQNDVHFLWSLSKDFGASGFRIGVLYSQNEELLKALTNLNIFSGVSHPMQMIIAEVLMDESFIDAFLDDARAQLAWSYTICTRKLDEMVIPYVPAEAGLFVYVDFSSLLPEKSFEGEERFATLVQDAARIVMTPGQSHRDYKPGMFRICYAWVTSDVLEIAMERLSYLVLQLRRINWDDLNPDLLSDVVQCGKHSSFRRNFSINLADLTHSNDT